MEVSELVHRLKGLSSRLNFAIVWEVEECVLRGSNYGRDGILRQAKGI